MVKKASVASQRDRQKAEEYARLMDAKRGIQRPANRPLTPIVARELSDIVLEAFPGSVVVETRENQPYRFANEANEGMVPITPTRPISSHRYFRSQGICGICKATSSGIGWSSGYGAEPLWYCTECGPEAARRFTTMRRGKLNEYEQRAIEEAGAQSGQYLDSIGTTDLATLTPEEYADYCQKFLAGYVNHMRSLTADVIPEE